MKPKDGETYLDLTFGDGGHTIKLLETGLDLTILTLDRDPLAYFKSIEIAKHDSRIFPMCGKFSDMRQLFLENKIEPNSVDGIIVDLGLSNLQLNDRRRGFRLSSESLLDMRMDGERCTDSICASEVLNLLDQECLEQIFRQYGGEKYSKKYSDMIVDSRYLLKEIRSTSELSYLISSINSSSFLDKDNYLDNHSASKIFLALRMFVNNELNELNYLLSNVSDYLKKDEQLINDFNHDQSKERDILKRIDSYKVGKLAIISFNEQEDKIVKRHFNNLINNTLNVTNFLKFKAKSFVNSNLESNLKTIKNRRYLRLNKSVIRPSDEEQKLNLRAASAKLRIAARIE